MLIYVHRNRKVYLGRGAHDGHLDFHTASELRVREGGRQGWREMYAQLRCENEWVELKMCHIQQNMFTSSHQLNTTVNVWATAVAKSRILYYK